MALNKKIGYGWVLSIDPAGGTSYTALANVVDGWSGPKTKARTPDTSVLADFWDTFMKEGCDPGEITFDVALDPEDTNYILLNTALANTSAPAAFQIDPPAATAMNVFQGWITSLSPEVRKGALAKAEVTIKVTGNPDLV